MTISSNKYLAPPASSQPNQMCTSCVAWMVKHSMDTTHDQRHIQKSRMLAKSNTKTYAGVWNFWHAQVGRYSGCPSSPSATNRKERSHQFHKCRMVIGFEESSKLQFLQHWPQKHGAVWRIKRTLLNSHSWLSCIKAGQCSYLYKRVEVWFDDQGSVENFWRRLWRYLVRLQPLSKTILDD